MLFVVNCASSPGFFFGGGGLLRRTSTKLEIPLEFI